FAIPGQTMEMWRATLTEALALGSEHLSCYEVIYEEDTPLYAQLRAHEFDVDEELACAMYEELLEGAAGSGFQQYEVANFARVQSKAQSLKSNVPSDLEVGTLDLRLETLDFPFFACRHNVNYWRGGEYYGLGPSACGYVGGVRTKNWANTQLYC